MTAPDWAKRFADGFIAHAPHMAALGIRPRAHGDGWAELEMPFAPHLVAYPDFGTVASGAIYALLDSTAGLAASIARAELVPVATLDLRLDYLRAPAPRATIVGRADCVRMTRTIAFMRGIAHDGDSADPIATMAGTFMFTTAEAVAP